MNPTVLILLSMLSIQGAHSYLLLSQRDHRQWSISEHALKNRWTRAIYFAGHFLGGVFFLLATNQIFIGSARYIFFISIITVLLEWLQGATPAKIGRVVSAHSVFAYAMWIGFMVIALTGMLTLPLEAWQLVVGWPAVAAIYGMFIYLHFDKRKIYHLQYATIYCFFLAMFVLATIV